MYTRTFFHLIQSLSCRQNLQQIRYKPTDYTIVYQLNLIDLIPTIVFQ